MSTVKPPAAGGLVEGSDGSPPPPKAAPEKRTVSYRVLKVIGQGSFGTVYQGRDSSGKIVAIKKVLQDPRYRNREFRIMRTLNHPFVVRLKESFYSNTDGKQELYLNLVMDFIPETIYQHLRILSKNGMFLPMVKLYFYQMVRSLLYIHSLGICHRDIKPQNVLLFSDQNHCQLIDFGSAKYLSPGEPNISYICSRYYRSPELIFGATEYTNAVDVWSIGCVLAEMLLGRPLFPGENTADQLIEIIKVVGTPSKSDIYSMNPSYKEVHLPDLPPSSWPAVLKRQVAPELIDLLNRLFVYNPQKRISPMDILLHSFFDELRSPSFSLEEPYPDLFSFTPEGTPPYSPAPAAQRFAFGPPPSNF